jgi:hypothetical protein
MSRPGFRVLNLSVLLLAVLAHPRITYAACPGTVNWTGAAGEGLWQTGATGTTACLAPALTRASASDSLW